MRVIGAWGGTVDEDGQPPEHCLLEPAVCERPPSATSITTIRCTAEDRRLCPPIALVVRETTFGPKNRSRPRHRMTLLKANEENSL
jgi:hypothetical protein